MSLISLAISASEDVEVVSTSANQPPWVYGVGTLVVLLLLLWLVTRLNVDR